MDVERLLRERGGLATRAHLLSACSRAEVDRALRHGAVVAIGRGRYTLPTVDAAAAAAHRISGALCLTSAALHHGWEVKSVPDRPHVMVPANRKLRADVRRRLHVHRGSLHESQLDGIATSKERTLEMCSRMLPFDEALSVVDSALRHEDVLPGRMRALAAIARGPGSAQMRRVAQEADGEAANPFESTLRAIALDVPGLHVKPQLVVKGRRVWARPDMTDLDLRIVIEAESFEWHGNRAGFDKDVRRYTRLTVEDWHVLRFLWEQVMFKQWEVRDLMCAMVDLVHGRSEGPSPTLRSA